MKKRKGQIDQFIIPIIGIIAMFVITISAINYINTTNKFIAANQIARKYIMKIETKGYLTNEDKIKMVNELTNQGFNNIDITGTSLNKVINGEDIFLKFKYDQTIRSIKIEGTKMAFRNEIKRITISRSSTSKN